ncbi:MAG: hypothetical protein ACOH2K_03635 [Burkholderiaceae bacterium]
MFPSKSIDGQAAAHVCYIANYHKVDNATGSRCSSQKIDISELKAAMLSRNIEKRSLWIRCVK